MARFFVLSFMVFCGLFLPNHLSAQGYYTLTNGRLWWSNGLEHQPDSAWKDPIAFDAYRGDAEVHPHGADHLTHITVQGDTYLALDTANLGTETNPKFAITSRSHDQFNLFCVWYRTGTTGYYYQEWTDNNKNVTYRYYLIGSSELVGSVDYPGGLRIVRSEVGKPLPQSTYWYNWDFGAAAWEKPIIGGVQKDRYYWVMLDNLDENNGFSTLNPPVWRLSNNSYERPEDILYLMYSDPDTVVTRFGTDSAEYNGKNANRLRYYDDVNDNNLLHYPAGNGALFMPVTVVPHGDTILGLGRDGSDQPYGLQNQTRGAGINVRNLSGNDIDVLAYTSSPSAQAALTVNMNYAAGNTVPMTVRQAYTEYLEETYRRGIHLNYLNRTNEGVFGDAGQATIEAHYFWGNSLHTVIPTAGADNTTVDTIIYKLDNRSRRYAEIVVPDPAHPEAARLVYDHPVDGSRDIEIMVTVRYRNGAVQTDTAVLTLTYTKTPVNLEPAKGPVVRGSVFGGGRMANVGGNTVIKIHSADSIQTVYGGNDIAGWVQGDSGATIQIGTEYTNQYHPVHIGNVYGGGNGYYTYQGINAGYDEATGQHINPYFQSQSTSLIYQAYYFRGKVYPWNSLPAGYLDNAADADRMNHDASAWSGLSPVVDHQFDYTPFYIGHPEQVDQQETGDDGDGTIPYIKTAHITVGVPEGTATVTGSQGQDSTVLTPYVTASGDSTYKYNDYILIDTLFGGARNAFIGVTANEGENPENGVSIDFNGGTCFALFGGNNVGGSVANSSTVFVNVHDTKLVGPDEEIDDTWLTGYGRDFGIRYLFGGGNLVEGSHANVTIFGGMLDTVYLGGNRASVRQPIGTMECRRDPRGNATTGRFGYNGHFICTNPSYPTLLDYTDPVAALVSNEHFFDGFGPGTLETETGQYNVKCLFGGNNAADMENQTIIKLHSGGVSSVYGGGNEGDMNNDQLYDVVRAPGDTIKNELFPDPLYNYYIQEAFDVDYATRAMRPGGWAERYGRATMPNKVGAIVTALPSSKIVCDYVFGGSRMGNIKNSCGVYLAGGTYGYVNGGNDISGDIGSETGGGTYLVLSDNVLVMGDAIAGSDGFYHCDDGTGHYDDAELFDTYSDNGEAVSYDPYDEFVDKIMPTHNNVNLYMRGGLVLGQLYGGGVHANVGFEDDNNNWIRRLDTDPASPTYGQRKDTVLTPLGGAKSGSIHFMAKAGHVKGNSFGGGYQSKTHGLAYLTLKDNIRIDGSFFSGNDCTGSINAFGAYINPDEVVPAYAAGMSAEDSAAALSTAMDAAYGAMVASDGSALNNKDQSGTWTPNYSAYLRIVGTPDITNVYGSGNGAYNYDGSNPEYETVSFCPDRNGEGITPLQSSTFIDINTEGGTIDTVFGGGNGVGVEKNVVVLLNNTTEGVHTVHTIFGGNNRDDMNDVVPEIRLLKGQVNTVYGGANNGAMGALWAFVDANGDSVKNVSTHVLLESEYVSVLDTIFGGCRMSDVKGSTFVEVRNTRSSGTIGVNYIFGGNDISGNILGNTRIDISNGVVKNLFGGSNGYYDFVEVGDNLFNIYPYGFVNRYPQYFDNTHINYNPTAAALTDSLITTAGRPDVDSTSVNLWGGTVGNPDDENGGVYGGGAMANCRSTSVIVNDTIHGNDRNLTIVGTVYGGGMGHYDNLNARDLQGNRYGNIDEATHVHLYHADAVTSAKAYGGGRGGDVMHTYINTYSGWDTPFDQLYGGCWGSDVFGTAHLDFAGIDLVYNLFGGNDFAGEVYRTEIAVHSGRFFNVFGAGNGDYPDSLYVPTRADHIYYGEANNLRRPNTEYVNLTFYDGEVEGNLFGGGRMGTTMTYRKTASGDYVLDSYGHKIPDTTMTVNTAHQNPLNYSYVITNIHGGYFHNSVYGGAMGNSIDMKPLVYGVKVLNMDGGEIRMNLYGGSQSVNDGYVAECKDATTTTRRPSSIVNLTGGLVEGNLYGAGYLGTTYGSVYVNVGTDAIDSCRAYSSVYATGSADSLYKIFKPGVDGGLSPALGQNKLVMNHSIFAGANWGAGAGNANFFTPGFKGGESLIIVDGKGYNTGVSELSSLPQMNIKKSIFGSGTSVTGGDVRSEINLWNYGELDNCHPTKELESVQRTDRYLSHNTAVHYLGATDATSAYVSAPYTIMRVDTMSFRGFNVAEYDASLSYINDVMFYKEPLVAGEMELVPVQNLRDVPTSPTACGPTANSCDYTYVVDALETDKKHTLLILNNGIDFAIQDENQLAGHVGGFGYVATPVGYSSSIIGQATVHKEGGNVVSDLDQATTATTGDWLENYAGFASPCSDSNRYTSQRGANPVAWVDSQDGSYSASDAEFPYINFINETDQTKNYREWTVGKGIRLRETAILAHADPKRLDQDANVKINDTSLALAKASITLPPTAGGHYYKLNNGGISISGSSSSVNLVDQAWYTTSDFAALDTAFAHGTDVAGQGEWKNASLELADARGIAQGAEQIVLHPDNTFGLLMVPGQNFKTAADTLVMPDDSLRAEQANLVLSGNAYYNASGSFFSPQVAAGDRITPTMDFMLTYNPAFASTFLGTVEFTLDEYDEHDNPVGPVRVKLYISTIIEEFRNIETNVLAMFNNGTSNTFTRRVILPITIDENRELYVTGVMWEPTDGNGIVYTGSDDKFNLAEKSSTITGATPYGVNNLFGLWLQPNDAVTGDLNENLGWTSIERDSINLYTLAYPTGGVPHKWAMSAMNDTVSLISPTAPNGMRVGVLDGRGTAALNVNLMYDGERIYPQNDGQGYLGKAELKMRWVKGIKSGDFKFTIYVKTRSHGDTIYIASADSVTRGGVTVRPYFASNSEYDVWMHGQGDSVSKAPTVIGKTPNSYVQSFQHALNSNVYQEGDVIAILDTVKINERPVHIQGADGPPIQVIRYDGHHHHLPSENGVYRGPMIEVSGQNNLFTAQNIDFHGSAGALNKRTHSQITVNGINYTLTGDKEPDTNRAFAPIIVVKDNGAVTLMEGTKVRHNWNNNQTGLPKDMGAISVTSGGTLTLKGDVSVRDNLGYTFAGDNSADGSNYNALRPYNGAIYIDGGYLVLPQSHSKTAVDVTRNRLIPATGGGWWNLAFIDGKPSRFTLDTTMVYNTWDKANVFLTRTEPATGTEYEKIMNDQQTDVILVSGTLGTNTKIGVRKWFPGATERDTIRFAVNTGADFTIMERAYQNQNFLSDDDFRVFFNPAVNTVTEYFFRCATFRHQMTGRPIAAGLDAGTGRDVLHYGILESNSCPTGGDSLIYRIQGGFAPYSYTWEMSGTGGVGSYNTVREYTSPYPNTVVTNSMNMGFTQVYEASIADTLLTSPIVMPAGRNDTTMFFRVAAVDATGECNLQKDITVNIHKVGSLASIPTGPSLWQPVTTPSNGWTDTATYVAGNRKTAVGDRYYKSIVITPYVSHDPTSATVTAAVNGEILQYIDEENRNDLAGMLFCEGDVIRLMTQPTNNGAEFLMWSFDPFNTNPATYVVPPHDDDVIAYYGSKIYWNDTINTPAEAGVTNAETYDYTTRPNVSGYSLFAGSGDPVTESKAGYVTTYQGDVHIYNENGLAWFISVVNGLNGYQARPFQFNTVYLHKKPQVDDGTGNMIDDPYDMQKFLWSPVGTRQYGFRGRLMGVDAAEASTTPLADEDRVIIKNIVLNEPNMNYVGFFGLLQSAECTGVALQNILVRGSQYVGGFAAKSEESTIENCAVDGSGRNTSIITTNYVSGGMVGTTTNTSITKSNVEVRYTGNAVYSGGVTGLGESDSIINNSVRVDSYASGVYVGGATGSSDGSDDDGCHLSNLRATVMGMTEASDGHQYNVEVSWQTDASDIMIGYCAGYSWDETSSSWSTTNGNSTNLTIYGSDTTTTYTVAVKVNCGDSVWNMMTCLVSVEDYVGEDACASYEDLSAEVISDNGTNVLHVTWRATATPSDTSVWVGYRSGINWNSSTSMSSYASTAGANGVDFPLSGYLDSAYTVALYSSCSDRWYYYTYYRCPMYRNLTADYTAPDGTTPTNAHTVTVYWRNASNTTENNVELGICPGTTWNTSTAMTQVPANSNANNDGLCSYTFTLSNVSSYVYTVALKSPCSGSMYMTSVEIPYGCPSYTITSAVMEDSVFDSHTSHYVNVLWTNSSDYEENNINVTICQGGQESTTGGNCQTFTASASSNMNTNGQCYASFNIDTIYAATCTTYTVTLRSTTCSNSVATATVNANNSNTCPSYTLATPVYTPGSSDMTHVSDPSVTMSWSVNTPTADGNQVMVAICAGTQWPSNPSWMEISTADNAYTFTGDYLPSLGNETAYTVGLLSLCDQSVYTQTVDVTAAGTQGFFGPLAGSDSRQHGRLRKRGSGGRTVIANNYVHITGNSRSQRIGGIAGRASNTDIMNNYVFGVVNGSETGGGVTAVMENGTRAVDNFTETGAAQGYVGRQMGGMLSNSATFEGSGNRVKLDRSVNGVDNLTRVLNRWVREQNARGGNYLTWRSDLDEVNYGYPLFGDPDMIPVEANVVVDGCSEVLFDGIFYTRDTVVSTRIVDSVEMVDSIVTATVRLHYGTHTMVSDSVPYGANYDGYGFSISADELRMLDQTLGSEGRASIVLHDTLTTEYGCDSIVTLTLTFTGSNLDIPEVEEEFSINVYPNPTTGLVNVEAEGMTHVEVYDNEGRRLQNYNAYGSNKVTVDMTRYVTGVYFVRVHSPKAVVIQKVIKER